MEGKQDVAKKDKEDSAIECEPGSSSSKELPTSSIDVVNFETVSYSVDDDNTGNKNSASSMELEVVKTDETTNEKEESNVRTKSSTDTGTMTDEILTHEAPSNVVSGCFCWRTGISNWFPKMCSCLDSGSPMSGTCASGNSRTYGRLGSCPTLFDYSTMMQRARIEAANNPDESVDSERQAELTFYSLDLAPVTISVEKNLRSIDLCELLKVKRNGSGSEWSLVETWPELGIERTLEDHEDVLATHREMEMFASHHERKFVFRKDFLKYEFFIAPKQFFPPEMVTFPSENEGGPSIDDEVSLSFYLAKNNTECPQVFSLVWLRDDDSSSWKKTYMLLQGRKLYESKKNSFPKSLKPRLTSPKNSTASKSNSSNLRSISPNAATSSSSSANLPSTSRSFGRFQQTNVGTIPKRTPISKRDNDEGTTSGKKPRWEKPRWKDNEQPSPLAHLSDYHIYNISNAKRFFDAPFEWGICLRPSSHAEAEDTEAGVPGLKVIAFGSEKSRACWLTTMRLAKYGKQLRENYRAFKNKQCEQNSSGSTKEKYSTYNVGNESMRSRVAMDFTGSVGRIVEDPEEAKDIAENEGIMWRRRWKPFSRPIPGSPVVKLHGLDRGIHVLQPWFHSGLSREYAASLIRDYGSVDGVFLVRDSRSHPESYVLTYKYNETVHHTQIYPVYDDRRNRWLYSLDKGVTKFFDVLQLVEFYQLNTGSLPTKLTHFIQNNQAVEQQIQDGVGASPSAPSSGNQNMSPKSDCPKSSSGI